MASRRSHAALDSKLIESELRVPRSGTYIMKPTASCEAAQLWVRAISPPKLVPRRGTDASRMMLRMIVGSAMGGCVATARHHSLLCLPFQL